MSVSDRQLAANQANAKLSTGPKTDAGKKKSALNGQRHGLTGNAFYMTEDDRQAWLQFSVPFIDSLQPANFAERRLAEVVAVAQFRLGRIHAIEENTFALGHFNRAGAFDADHPQLHDAFTQARVFDFEGKLFHNLSLYEQRITNAMHKNLKALHDLQDRRKAEERETQAREAEAARHKQAPKQKAATATGADTKTQSVGQGFAFSAPESHHPQTSPHPQTPPLNTPKAA